MQIAMVNVSVGSPHTRSVEQANLALKDQRDPATIKATIELPL